NRLSQLRLDIVRRRIRHTLEGVLGDHGLAERQLRAAGEQAPRAFHTRVVAPQPQGAVGGLGPASERSGNGVQPLPLAILDAEAESAVRPRALDDRARLV